MRIMLQNSEDDAGFHSVTRVRTTEYKRSTFFRGYVGTWSQQCDGLFWGYVSTSYNIFVGTSGRGYVGLWFAFSGVRGYVASSTCHRFMGYVGT